jgi:hypothetical protein
MREWFDTIYRYGYEQLEKVNILAEGDRLFRQYEQHGAEPTLHRMQVGRDRWQMGSFKNPLNEEGEER